MAILRLGSRVPGPGGPDAAFLYGCPPLVKYPQAAVEQPLPALPELPGAKPEDDEAETDGVETDEEVAPEADDQMPRPAPAVEEDLPEKLPAAESATFDPPRAPGAAVRPSSLRFGKWNPR